MALQTGSFSESCCAQRSASFCSASIDISFPCSIPIFSAPLFCHTNRLAAGNRSPSVTGGPPPHGEFAAAQESSQAGRCFRFAMENTWRNRSGVARIASARAKLRVAPRPAVSESCLLYRTMRSTTGPADAPETRHWRAAWSAQSLRLGTRRHGPCFPVRRVSFRDKLGLLLTHFVHVSTRGALVSAGAQRSAFRDLIVTIFFSAS